MSATSAPISEIGRPVLKVARYPDDLGEATKSFFSDIQQAHEVSKKEALTKAKRISESSLKSLLTPGSGSILLQPFLRSCISKPSKTMAWPVFAPFSGAGAGPNLYFAPPPTPAGVIALAPPYNYGWPDAPIKHITSMNHIASLGYANPAEGRMEVAAVVSSNEGDVQTPEFYYSGALAAVATWAFLPPLSQPVDVTVLAIAYVHGDFLGWAINQVTESALEQVRRVFIDSAVTLYAAPFLNGKFDTQSARQNLYWKLLGATPSDSCLSEMDKSFTCTLAVSFTVPESCPILVGVASEALTIATRFGQAYDCFAEVDVEGYSQPQPVKVFDPITVSPQADGGVFVPSIAVSWKEI